MAHYTPKGINTHAVTVTNETPIISFTNSKSTAERQDNGTLYAKTIHSDSDKLNTHRSLQLTNLGVNLFTS